MPTNLSYIDLAKYFISNKRISGARRNLRGHLGGHNPPRCASPPRRTLVGAAHLVTPLTLKPTLLNPIFLEKIREKELL